MQYLMDDMLELRLTWFHDRLRRDPAFSHDHCSSAAEEARKQFRFSIVSGWFETDKPHPGSKSRKQIHCWNEDEEDTIIDMCAYQFNDLLYKPVEEGVLIVRKGTELYERYHRSKKLV
jgi:hypothetical protein